MSKLLTYDLRTPGRDYSKLYEAIKKYDYAKPAESCYILKTSETCVQVRDYLFKYMDSNDGLFVAELTGAAAWYNALCGDDELKKRL